MHKPARKQLTAKQYQTRAAFVFILAMILVAYSAGSGQHLAALAFFVGFGMGYLCIHWVYVGKLMEQEAEENSEDKSLKDDFYAMSVEVEKRLKRDKLN